MDQTPPGPAKREENDEHTFVSLPDRPAISEAIHRRYPLECGALTRAMKAVVAYPSLKDRFRSHLRLNKELASLILDGTNLKDWESDPRDDDEEGCAKKEAAQRRLIRKTIEQIGLSILDYKDHDTDDVSKSNDKFKDIRDRCLAIFKQANDIKSSQYYDHCKVELAKFSEDLRASPDITHKFVKDESDFHPGSAARFSESLTSYVNTGHRMRIRWEGHTHNHAAFLIEDIKISGQRIIKTLKEIKNDNTKFDEAKIDGMPLKDICNFASLRFDSLTSFSEFYNETKGGSDIKVCHCRSPISCEAHELATCRRGGSRRDVVEKLTPQLFGDDTLELPKLGVLNVAAYWMMPIGLFIREYINSDTGVGASFAKDERSELKRLLRRSARDPNLVKDGEFTTDEMEMISSSIQRLAVSASREEVAPNYQAEEIFRRDHEFDRRAVDGALAESGLRFVVKAMQRWFQYGAESAPDQILPREDFVVSFISGGRGLLISDLRPERREYSRNKFVDGATRTIILDLGMHKEERGRLLQRLTDIATFRHLGLRGYPYVNDATNALNHLGAALNKHADASDDPHTTSDDIHKLRRELMKIRKIEDDKELKAKVVEIEKEIDEILQNLETKFFKVSRIADALDLLNLFFTYGVSGKANSTAGYSRHIRENLVMLREARAPGYQTLKGYLDRYFACAHEIEMLRSRYQTLRARVNEATDLIRTRHGQMLGIQLNLEAAMQGKTMEATRRTAKWSLRTALGALGITFAALVIGAYFDWQSTSAHEEHIKEILQVIERLSGSE
ncbi:MAG: DUF3422 family protein [Pseudomonadota bacterium]